MKTIIIKAGSNQPGNFHPLYQVAARKTYWTKKRIVFLFMIIYGVAVSALMSVLIAKFI